MPTVCAPCPGKRNAILAMRSVPQTGRHGDKEIRREESGCFSPCLLVSVSPCLERLFLLFHHHDLSPLVVPTVRTHAVRQHRFVALGAVLNLHGLDVLVAPPLALAGVRSSSLRYGPRSSPRPEN